VTRIARAIGCLLIVPLSALLPAHQDPQPPVFRGRVALVPVDVRVLDRQGRPVADLTQADFTILEDGVPQTIGHFAIQEYRADHMAPGVPAPDAEIADPLRAPDHRTFLIVFGRGRLQGPSKGFDALLEFIDRHLRPTDRIGVVAYDRITDLTTDRDAVRRLVDRYREHHELIEALLDHWFRGLTIAFDVDGDPHPNTQVRIDNLFDAPGLPRTRRVVGAAPSGEGMFHADRERILQSLGQAASEGRRGFSYVAATRQDMEKLYAGIEHLRHVEGEKHLVFVSYEGLLGAGADTLDRLARMAADARVTVSTIQTGGIFSDWQRLGPVKILVGPTWRHRWAVQDLRAVARDTGGIASFYQYASQAFERIDRATQVQYLLGYYPRDPDADGDFRRISVRVNRPGVQVLHRGGYYAQTEPLVYDRRALVTNARMSAAAGYRSLIEDIPLTLSASVRTQSRDGGEVDIEVRVAPGAIAFTESAGRQTAALDVALHVGDTNRRQIGELRKRIDLNLLPENYLRVTEDGVVFSATVPFKGRARHVKAVVFEYSTDSLGTAVLELRR
jgi:VWFA-related protein